MGAIKALALEWLREQAWKRNGSIRIGGGIRCGNRGFWFRRIAPSAPGRVKWDRRPRLRGFLTIRNVIFAPATSGPAELSIRPTTAFFLSSTTTRPQSG